MEDYRQRISITREAILHIYIKFLFLNITEFYLMYHYIL